MNIVILAAGTGKRMRSALPKVLHPLAGRPLLSHVIATARTLQPSRLVVVVGHGAEQVQAAVAAPDVQFAVQAEQLGTGHAVRQALPLLDPAQPTLVLYGDVPLTRATTLKRLVDAAHDGRYGILTVTLDEPTGYGRIVRDAAGFVTRIVEQKDASPEQLKIAEINTGIIVTPTAQLSMWLGALKNENAQGEYYLTDVVELAIEAGFEIVTTQPDDDWETLGVNSKAQLAELERIHQRNVADALLVEGVTLADPARVDVRGTLRCGRDVSIDVNCVFEGDVTLADDVTVGPNCVIRNASIGAGTRIDAFTHIDGAQLGANTVIGPYARLRPGAQLADEAHVGNFVEVKNAVIGHGSKANHLTYIGDADIGARVNIGAGTITCNYDGANKFRTVIEDDVFVGSDTQLVAPVRVGRGVTIAAGTTVWKDVAEGTLALNEKTQTAKSGYVRPVKKKS
ncbi:bifunctional UDP-N-acetylglucosamine diphosphorylase/glucosamine-1-phosphate N-acetyltransferase GlmU [Burkholderia vietnamiensis]|jgi:bifunctional UDP-N-acetylglucosamine pyrophosphorylase/glucosamine-1-phosphate N-acetyltransferase|uniref:bifunctional UDP-N-acetylglucosamine diphosphorylase/glucosamine-1-phosphate N-acetyltransferase GlmU n=1 Tax=Burkholderia TaxID=32008 RepID=UPI00055861FB|nr:MULTISPECIES: bifunctional UDP-N-acetylglucosamine diphosphorylase/glucosamine-1-phosphate N-acetyltransferase GlmU [Burkholderia]AJY07961.1 UDP-N-acetylglucosamine diphosphorylase/glucosamine-1-phosphate N-acetyltransferase [Burkholderia vietnamiensis LMG 10929]AOK01428.1 bifunctional N-acetylglucosamine-1-phosphate uridyltransferase/glucosamine-1-phosphate acetyltransferase [Burkholderia vietnamiensis]AVR16214.1 bifunctional N-acetylglucosamine-1-phosphate uridyltransferase/glucosamine-1-ph